MIIFIAVLVLTVGGIIGLVILMKRKESRIPIAGFGVAVLTIAFAVNLVSALYHQFGNEAEYEKVLIQRGAIVQALGDALASSDETAYSLSSKDAMDFNAELESERRFSESPWIGIYTFDYAIEHFDELYITIPRMPN